MACDFAPVTFNPSPCPWPSGAQEHDATELMKNNGPFSPLGPILVDQGSDDSFLEEQLRPEALSKACEEKGHPLHLRVQ
ncbi:unnamed protein product, partial [Discosporangium mesarthrocarpum]